MGMDLQGIRNQEAEFRASCWSWRPLQVLLMVIIERNKMDIDTSSFGYNDGAGIKSSKDCKFIAQEIRKEMETLLDDEHDTLYLKLGSWTTMGGEFLKADDTPDYDGKPEFITEGVVTPKGKIIFPTHSIHKDHIEEFCQFLDICKGFRIY